ncbi:hypothetical protein J6590_068353 [Homalodisca vitripennis]|nr:hypothetical protein J6590_068353 [Homalodisca vitripennis]
MESQPIEVDPEPLSVVSAGNEDEQPQPSPSTGGSSGDDDGAIDLAQPSTSRGGWSASGWSRRGQEVSVYTHFFCLFSVVYHMYRITYKYFLSDPEPRETPQ